MPGTEHLHFNVHLSVHAQHLHVHFGPEGQGLLPGPEHLHFNVHFNIH